MAKVQIPITCSVKVKDKEFIDSVSQIELDQRVDRHHSLLVHLVDTSAPGSGDDSFFDPTLAREYLGETVTVTMQYATNSQPQLKFVGTITQFSLANAVDGVNTLRITAASPTVLMDGAARYAQFVELSSSEAIQKVTGNYNITSSRVPSTSYRWKSLIQHGETDWAFIRRLATAEGFFCYYNGEQLTIEAPNTGVQHSLSFRSTLGSFSVGVGIEQPNYATVLYAEVDDRELRLDSKSVSKSRSLSGVSKIALDASERVFSGSSMVPIGSPGLSAGEGDKTVDRERSRAVERMLECEGTSTTPELRPGMTIEVAGLGQNSSGSYYVTGVQHRISDRGLYENTFQCIPVDAAFPQRAPSPAPAAGLHRATVVDNNDPEQLGRVKVKTAWYPQESSDWMRLVAPYAGNDYGWYVLPEIGDEVLVGYFEGDVQQPFVIGSLYNGSNKPPSVGPEPDNMIKLFQTKAGNLIKIDDTGGAEEITISSPGEKHSVVLSDKAKAITIKTVGDIKLLADGNIDLETAKDFNLKATGNVKIEGQKVEVKASGGDVKAEGMNVELKAQVGAKVEGGATAELKASGQTTVKGAMVMIN